MCICVHAYILKTQYYYDRYFKNIQSNKYLSSDSSVLLGKYSFKTSKLQISPLTYLRALSGWKPKVQSKKNILVVILV
jgi:hypothetical protein